MRSTALLLNLALFAPSLLAAPIPVNDEVVKALDDALDGRLSNLPAVPDNVVHPPHPPAYAPFQFDHQAHAEAGPAGRAPTDFLTHPGQLGVPHQGVHVPVLVPAPAPAHAPVADVVEEEAEAEEEEARLEEKKKSTKRKKADDDLGFQKPGPKNQDPDFDDRGNRIRKTTDRLGH